jgi:small subunit ribosomal protein S13
MPRLHGVDIPGDKKIEYALRYIYGVGPARARILCEKAGIDCDVRAHTLTEEELNRITTAIQELNYVTEGDLRREITSNLKRLTAIRCYRGLRHQRGLPVRGQRTQTNARTRKGGRKTVGVIKKK